MTAGGTFLASLLTLCAAVLEKKSKISQPICLLGFLKASKR
jgi:hypothetical protein